MSRERLREKLEHGADFVLVDVVTPMSFATAHCNGVHRGTQASFRIDNRTSRPIRLAVPNR
jgi:hypothetical protein